MSRRGPSGRFRKIGSVLPRVLRTCHLDKAMAAQSAVTLWPEVAGPKTAEHTYAIEVDGVTLVVAADSSAWLTQLKFLRPQLLKKLNARLGKGLVSDIRFVLGRGRRPGSA